MRECGLKQIPQVGMLSKIRVTPRAGVWIETARVKTPRRTRASLPVRECGLKPWHSRTSSRTRRRSLPVRECGLKLRQHGNRCVIEKRSLPVRECGLKRGRKAQQAGRAIVTPRAGVWIETDSGRADAATRRVTPRAGVWIETRTRRGTI